ncbi:hypothetical protein CHS0354_041681 [Potamilus streckersoni]|uniref:Cytochrome P450 n=1 Tax=Potamilus streckersoni TaxID=2493646 RepID=A0AAE0SDM4_9BIVA|nr:hypothetical protein CHS0354_041681 [Potamilus streckersoni]
MYTRVFCFDRDYLLKSECSEGFYAIGQKKRDFSFHPHIKFPGPNEEGLKFQLEKTKLYPLFHLFWVGLFRTVFVFHHYKSLKILLKASAPIAPKPRSIGTVYVLGLPWLGEGLLIANGDKWARNRRLLTPAFHFDILQPYIPVFNKCVDILLLKMEKQVAEDNRRKYFELFSFVGLCSLDIILRCAFSYDSDCQIKGDSHPYVQAVNELSDLWVERSLKPYLFPDWIYFLTTKGRRFSKHCDLVHRVAEDIIEKRKKTLEEEGLPNQSTDASEGNGKKSRYLDFLDILLTAKDENSVGLTPLEIRNEVDTFLFEGHDTTTSAISWILYSLATHPDIQQHAREEVDELLQGRDSDYITMKDVQKLEYLTMVIKEGLRYHSPVQFIQRVITEPIEVEDMKIPAGSVISMNFYNLHHNPEVWEDNMEFRPERFLPENMANKDCFSFLPFSAGQRNCIGQHFAMYEMKVVIGRILHRFIVEVDPDHVVRKKLGVVMRAENGIMMRVIPRTQGTV